MQLVLNTYGTTLRVKDGLFLVLIGDRRQEIAPKKISSIVLTTGVFMSTDVVKLAIEHNIDLLFLDKFGDPIGRVWHDRPGSITTIRRKQLFLDRTPEGLEFVKEWIGTKLDNQIQLLEKLRKTRPKHSALITQAIHDLEGHQRSLAEIQGLPDENRDRIMLLEAHAAGTYFTTLSGLLAEKYQFSGRSRNPAQDEFNCLLNYAYGVLYGKVERACVLAGLDPYIGILHTDNYAKKSLVFDLIENFRIWAEENVMAMFAAREVKDSQFEKLKNGMTLNKEGKAALLGRFMKYLEESVRFRNRNIKRLDAVQLTCHRFANRLVDKAADDIPDLVTGEEVVNHA